MRGLGALAMAVLLIVTMALGPTASAYLIDTSIPQGGGCPAINRWNFSPATPLNRRWSTSVPGAANALLTVAANGSVPQLAEIEQAITDSFGAWSGVTGTTFSATAHPGLFAPLGRVPEANACTNDAESDADALNTICFNQSSLAFSTGVLAFTRTITANAPGASVGSSGPAAFAGQILDADTLFRNDGQASFATPGALATAQGRGAYDLESLLIHELGHWLGFGHSAVWRAIMFPFAPPPGEFLGSRPTPVALDGPLSADDRTGIRVLYPDPADTVNVGAIRGRVLPANPFALASLPAPAPRLSVTGIFGAHVVAVDADTGSVIAGTLSGCSCDATTDSLQFDGSFDIERLPVAHNYAIYAEPLVGLAVPGDFGSALDDLCSSGGVSECTTPAVNVSFNPRFRPAGR